MAYQYYYQDNPDKTKLVIDKKEDDFSTVLVDYDAVKLYLTLIHLPKQYIQDYLKGIVEDYHYSKVTKI